MNYEITIIHQVLMTRAVVYATIYTTPSPPSATKYQMIPSACITDHTHCFTWDVIAHFPLDNTAAFSQTMDSDAFSKGFVF